MTDDDGWSPDDPRTRVWEFLHDDGLFLHYPKVTPEQIRSLIDRVVSNHEDAKTTDVVSNAVIDVWQQLIRQHRPADKVCRW